MPCHGAPRFARSVDAQISLRTYTLAFSLFVKSDYTYHRATNAADVYIYFRQDSRLFYADPRRASIAPRAAHHTRGVQRCSHMPNMRMLPDVAAALKMMILMLPLRFTRRLRYYGRRRCSSCFILY